MKAMILAAGDGTRMGKLTQHTPKPLLKVDQFSLIEHHLKRLKTAGFSEVVINIRYLGEQIKAALGDGSRYQLNIHYSPESHDLEVAGGIRNALPLLGTAPFLLLSADIWSDHPLQPLCQLTPTYAHLVMIPSHNPNKPNYGISENHLSTKQTNSPGWLYSGIGVFHPHLFASLPIEFCKLQTVLDDALKTNKPIECSAHIGNFLNVGTPEILEHLRQTICQPTT